MSISLSTHDELAANPELAALEMLGSTAAIARTALFATYPELISCGDFFVEETDVTPRQCLVVAVVTALDTLIDSIEHYRGHLDNLASRRAVSKAGADDTPF
jgi:hypothetical protein